jgi:hypothetical protein
MGSLFFLWKVGTYSEEKVDSLELNRHVNKSIIKTWKTLNTMSADTAYQKLVEHHSTIETLSTDDEFDDDDRPEVITHYILLMLEMSVFVVHMKSTTSNFLVSRLR